MAEKTLLPDDEELELPEWFNPQPGESIYVAPTPKIVNKDIVPPPLEVNLETLDSDLITSKQRGEKSKK